MNSSPTAGQLGAGTGSRRWRFALMTGVMLLCVGGSGVLANVLSTRFLTRVDVTATGEHRLSPRTVKLLDSLAEPYRVVIAANFSQIDARARERVLDVLEGFARRTPNVKPVLLDTASADGVAHYDSLLRELTARDATRVRAHVEALKQAAEQTAAIGAAMESHAAPAMIALRDRFTPPPKTADAAAPPNPKPGTHEALDQRLGALRVLALELSRSAGEIRGALAWDPQSGKPPEVDTAQKRLGDGLGAARKMLLTLAGEMSAFQKAEGLPTDIRELALNAQTQIEKLRDATLVSLDALARLPRLDIVRLAEALRAPAAVLIVGPQGISALDPVSLFPPGELLDLGGAPLADMRRRSEDLLATAISSLRNPIKPIVVLMHGENREFLDQAALLDRARQRLALRGIDMFEWAAAVNPAAPDLSVIDPKGQRPVVYAVFSTAAWTATEGGGASGAERASKLGGALDAIAESGRPILLSLNPSPMPSYGQKDPVASVLERFGLAADSGRPLLRESVTPRGRVAETDLVVQGSTSSHVIAQALGRLPLSLPWSVPIAPATGATPTWIPICTVAADGATWAESNWLGLRKTRREDRALVPDQPEFDAGKDSEQGPWAVVAAAERTMPEGSIQRLIVVGSNDWFIDPVLTAESIVDGRVVSQSPGNIELLEASVYWLSGQDDLIARSPAGQSTPMVKPLERRTLVLLQIAFIAGVPLLVLGLGGMYRAMFG